MNCLPRWIAPAALCTAALAVAATLPHPSPPDEVLHEAMEGLKRNLKTLATATPEPERRAEALAAVAEMQRLVLLAKAEEPSNLGEMPEDGRAAHALAFRRDLAKLLVELGKVEIALCEDRPADVLEAVKGTLFEIREAAHDAYQESGEHAEGEDSR